MSQDFNRRTNDERPNIHPLQSGMDIPTSPTSGSTSSSYRFTLQMPSGTSTSSSSNQDQNERQLADSDSQTEMELMLSGIEETIKRMETRICALHNHNQQGKEGREVLQEKCRVLEVAVRDREGEVATLRHQLKESEQGRERATQELRMQRYRTEDDVASFVHVEERTEANHDVYEQGGLHVQWQAPAGSSQAVFPPMEQNTDPSSMRQPRPRQQTAPGFIGGFAWK